MSIEKLVEAQNLVKHLQTLGMIIYIRGDEEILICRPSNLLTDDLRQEIKEKKQSLYTYLLREELRKILKLVEMANIHKNVPLGLREDWEKALRSARNSVYGSSSGDIWGEK